MLVGFFQRIQDQDLPNLTHLIAFMKLVPEIFKCSSIRSSNNLFKWDELQFYFSQIPISLNQNVPLNVGPHLLYDLVSYPF